MFHHFLWEIVLKNKNIREHICSIDECFHRLWKLYAYFQNKDKLKLWRTLIHLPNKIEQFSLFNDIHMDELVLYWKNSLKYKVDFFWRFWYVYTIN